MDYQLIDPLVIDADPHNLRVITPHSVAEMAASIEEHGLLQNLVVEKYGTLSPKGKGEYLCKAGNRRLLAIKKLTTEGKWKEPIVCLVVGDGSWSQIVENVMRQDLPFWRLGARLVELRAAGFTKQNIAARLGLTIGKTSMLVQIAEGLAPQTVEKIEQLPHGTLGITDLCKIARLFNPETLRPDPEAQGELLGRLLNKPRRSSSAGKPITERQTVWRRYRKLRDHGIKIPLHAEAYVEAMVRYLAGEDERLRVIR